MSAKVQRRGKAHAILSGQSLTDFIEEIPFPVLRISIDGVIIKANKGSWIILSHWKRDEGQAVPPEFMEILNKTVKIDLNNEIELQIGFKVFLLAIVSVPENGYADLFGFDITQRKQVENKLQLDAQVFESASEGIMITDTDQRILDVNNAFCSITGYEREEILGENASILQSGRHSPLFYKKLWKSVKEKGSWQGEIWDRKKNGDIYPKLLTISSVVNDTGKVIRYIGLFSDISVMKATEEKLYHMANFDVLTGLVNRRYFQDQLEKNLHHARRLKDLLALMFIDLDGFKLLNDNFGHQSGDQTLRIVAERLMGSIRDTDIVARMGGDEFTIILPFIKNTQNIAAIADKILRHITRPIKLKNADIFISASIGIAIFPNDARSAEELLQNSDAALYRAKEIGKNLYQFFSPEMNKYVKDRLAIHARLRHALDKNQFRVYYQPQYDIKNNRIIGMESLIRWKPGNNNFIDPDYFIPIAEETGLINEIGEFVLKSACGQGKKWLDENILHVPISVNISVIQLRHPDFIKKIKSIIDDSGFPPEKLEIEITETILIESVGDIRSKLEQLKSLGCSIVIDDFGTKYSSFSYLKILPIDKLKIDKSFIRDISEDNKSADIVKAIIAMGHSLNLKVISEGVETQEQIDFLKKNGCFYIQGFYYSNPVPAAQIHSLLVSENQNIKEGSDNEI